jgi:hypothetical protein
MNYKMFLLFAIVLASNIESAKAMNNPPPLPRRPGEAAPGTIPPVPPRQQGPQPGGPIPLPLMDYIRQGQQSDDLTELKQVKSDFDKQRAAYRYFMSKEAVAIMKRISAKIQSLEARGGRAPVRPRPISEGGRAPVRDEIRDLNEAAKQAARQVVQAANQAGRPDIAKTWANIR